jgi:hypothetical protein
MIYKIEISGVRLVDGSVRLSIYLTSNYGKPSELKACNFYSETQNELLTLNRLLPSTINLAEKFLEARKDLGTIYDLGTVEPSNDDLRELRFGCLAM